ncbi:DegT/DnrJ/EryC1/StrS aminotransferase [Streptomyces sp. NRRL B-1677]|uniref:DegT/DnrJ/EryC1/StrS family aminotransferase n=1 Tax=Streptomyces sp. NRRL B-1677 TaxID=2682966 RepID=UPI0018928A1E|nr:DegT/DnrJ/EryC1/StrS family aminotransferase [Streptomyces sp. NRRL B-1677]MBF6046069.1 DegT/DnrJ/EryC1/StrS aminotransferase [Streptomyces sp. NRRL B-1677]
MQIHRLRQLLSVERALGPAPGAGAGTSGTAASAGPPTGLSAGPSADWSRRVRAVVERLARAGQDTLAAAPDGPPEESDGFVRERLLFDSPARGRFRAAVLAPAGTGPLPAVLVLGGRNARLDQLTGAEPPGHPDRDVAAHLARAGFLTLALDHGIDGGLDADRLAGRDEGTVLAHAFALRGHSLLGALLGDALAALGWLRGHPRAAAGRTGLFGHSLGAAVALHTALLAPEPLPVCAAGHLGSYPALFARLLTGFEGAALPGILEYADLPELYGALAPAPLQLQYGLRDPFLDPADAREGAAAVRRAYAGAGAADRLEVLELDLGHGTDRDRAAAFFSRSLAGPCASPAASAAPVPAQRVRFTADERRTVTDRVDAALASGVLTQGPEAARFEALARTWTGGREAVAVSSGTAALEIALRILDVAGRTVLTPVNTFFATAAAAVRAGARVRFVDIELDGLGMDPEALRRALDGERDVAAVVPVHIGGVVSPALEALLEECRERGVPVLEDAAHAFGSTLDGRAAGAFGRFGAFSFFPTKVATSGEGGLLTGARAGDMEAARCWRDHGRSAADPGRHDRPGGNWRMGELPAAVGTVDLERFGTALAARRAAAARYDELLAGMGGLRPFPVPKASGSNFYKYLAYLDDGVDRAAFKARLRERHGVAAAGEVYDTLLCDQPFFRGGAAGAGGGGDPVAFPRARWFAGRHVALPLYPSLTEAEQFRVAAALRSELS